MAEIMLDINRYSRDWRDIWYRNNVIRIVDVAVKMDKIRSSSLGDITRLIISLRHC